jgi:hypothetical protein
VREHNKSQRKKSRNWTWKSPDARILPKDLISQIREERKNTFSGFTNDAEVNPNIKRKYRVGVSIARGIYIIRDQSMHT